MTVVQTATTCESILMSEYIAGVQATDRFPETEVQPILLGDGYGSSLPERKSSAIETMPFLAMASWRRHSVVRSLRHQAPPWHSTSAGNGPSPRGRNTRASSGFFPRAGGGSVVPPTR